MPSDNDITVTVLRTADTESLIRLYKGAGWWKKEYRDNLDFLNRIVTGSACFVGAFKGKTMVGMGRALSDGSSDAYIQDVTVLEPFRCQGIGKRIINRLILALKQEGVDWIGLIGEAGTTGFYEKLGFEKMAGAVPFNYKEKP